MAYNNETRDKAIKLYEGGLKFTEIGRKLKVSPTSVSKWVKDKKEENKESNITHDNFNNKLKIDEEAEVLKLKTENNELREKISILKQAIAIVG